MKDLVEPCVEGIGRDLPIVLLAGPRGSGGSRFLDSVENLYDGHAPLARIGRLPQAGGVTSVGALLSASMLAYDRKVFGLRLQFPRTLLGIAVAAVAAGGEAGERRSNLIDALNDRDGTTDRVRKVIAASVPVVRATLPSPATAVADVVSALDLGAATARFVGTRRHAVRWFAGAMGVPDALDALVKLNALAQGTAAGGGVEELDIVLTRAFLADLVAGFHATVRGRGRGRNCLLLLHDADTGPARAFLRVLAMARNAAIEGGDGLADPLLVVGTVHSRLGATRDSPATDPPSISAPMRGSAGTVGATWEYWRATRDPHPDRPWLLVVPVPPMSGAEDVTELVGDRAPAGALLMVRDVAAGHPMIARGLLAGRLDALRRAEPSNVVDKLVVRLLAADVVLLRRLSALAAVHTLTDENCRNALGTDYLPPELSRFLADDLWVRYDGASGRVLHPAFRRLLLHQLAVRAADDSLSWAAVHGRIAERNDDGRADDAHLDERTKVRLYHLLARYGSPRPLDRDVADLLTVIRRLDTPLGLFDTDVGERRRPSIERWWNDVGFVISAPRGSGSEPHVDLAGVRRGVAEWTPTARLVVARWLSGDALSDPRGLLLAEVADSCIALAGDDRLPPGGAERAFLRAKAAEADEQRNRRERELT